MRGGRFHPACLQQHMPDRMPDKEDTFICPMCFEAQAEMADVYISESFLAGFGGPGMSGEIDREITLSPDISGMSGGLSMDADL